MGGAADDMWWFLEVWCDMRTVASFYRVLVREVFGCVIYRKVVVVGSDGCVW